MDSNNDGIGDLRGELDIFNLVSDKPLNCY